MNIADAAAAVDPLLHDSILTTIGKTPLIKLRSLLRDAHSSRVSAAMRHLACWRAPKTAKTCRCVAASSCRRSRCTDCSGRARASAASGTAAQRGRAPGWHWQSRGGALVVGCSSAAHIGLTAENPSERMNQLFTTSSSKQSTIPEAMSLKLLA